MSFFLQTIPSKVDLPVKIRYTYEYSSETKKRGTIMDHANEESIMDIIHKLNEIDYINPEDIPNIDLYMDQVTTFMDEHLAACKRMDDDKILTKTMINNYTKNDFLPPPVKKKYSKEHMYLLIFLYYFKNVLSITDIQKIFKPLTDMFYDNNIIIHIIRNLSSEFFKILHLYRKLIEISQ